jgi:NodT family efflux transporter outer membrane factor (OMF) lipoprotein
MLVAPSPDSSARLAPIASITHRPAPSASPSLLLACLLTLSVMAACSTPQTLPPPPAQAPAAFKEAAPAASAAAATADATPTATAVPDAWWRLFNDPVLDDLQAQLVIGNQNLQAAAAQVANARALLGASRSAQAPSLSAGASAGRSDSGGAGGGQNSLSINANAAWEVDLWGRLSQASRGSEARYQASAADMAGVRLSAQAQLTQSYFALRAAEAQQALIERSIAAYQRSLELTRLRFEAGVVAPVDVLQAQTQLKTAQVQQIEAGNQRALAEHAIAVLIGQPPSALSLGRAPGDLSLPEPPAVPSLLPSTLLQRRPDIAAAERRVVAAYAQIGVADAGFFPSLTLSAGAGLRASSLSQFTSAPTLFWSLGTAAAQRLFDGGAQQAVSDQARANADQAGAVYRQTVLEAFQEVEDNLVLTERLRSEGELQREALQYAQRNLDITQDQYRAGTVSYLNVVTAQTTVLSAERNVLDLHTRQLGAVNQLLKNVAGRW